MHFSNTGYDAYISNGKTSFTVRFEVINLSRNPKITQKSRLYWKFLQTCGRTEEITFDQLLINLNVTEQNYYLAIRSGLNSPTVFLKRNPTELRVNNYNSACLRAWRANMDIQFVLDVYACAMYIVSYISKAQKGMSQLLQRACDEARDGNSSVKQQVTDIGNKFLNSVEISAKKQSI